MRDNEQRNKENSKITDKIDKTDELVKNAAKKTLESKSKVNIGKELSRINIVSNFGFTIIGNIIVGLILGLFFDNLFGTKKLFFFIFLFLGIISGIYNGIRYILKEVERYEKEERREKGKKT